MKKKILLLFCSLQFLFSFAQNPADVVQSFGSYPGFNAYVKAIALQPNGKAIMGGDFTTYNGETNNRIIRINTDGSIDATFNSGTGFNNFINKIVVQNDGKIIVIGFFTSYNGLTENRIIRLNSDGSKDTSFNTGTGFNGQLHSISLQTDGKIILGGGFSSYNGVNENDIIRLNSDGTNDLTFNNGTGFNGAVYSSALQADGKIILVGAFTTYNGATENSIIRLNSNGVNDTTFNNGTGLNFIGADSYNINFSTVIQPNGKIIIAGQFDSYNGVSQNGLIRLNSDGTKDTTLSSSSFPGIKTITLQPDGKIIVGGAFTLYNGLSENFIIRLNNDGTRDNTFNTGTGFSSVVFSTVLQSDGKIIIGGFFTSYNELTKPRIVRLNTDGTNDISYNTETGFASGVDTVALQADGKIIVGDSRSYDGVIESGIVRFNTDGTKDTTLNTGTGFNGSVRVLVSQPDGKIITGGSFTSYNGITENYIMRLNSDGTKDTSFITGTGFNGSISSIVLQPDGKIIIGGSFTSYNGLTVNRIIRLNNDGTKDTTFDIGTAFSYGANTIALQSDGKIIIGGFITSNNGMTQSYIARLNSNGTNDTAFNSNGTGFDAYVKTITIQADGKILVGGNFTSYNGINESKIIRLNVDGTKDTSFNSGTGFNNIIYSIVEQPDGKIIVGGRFNLYDGLTENRIIRLNNNGTKDTTFNTEIGFNTSVGYSCEVYNMVMKPDGNIIVAGNFTTYKDDASSAYLIVLHCYTPLSTTNFLNQNEVSLWPNPAQNILNIGVINNTITSTSIYNLQGKLIYVNLNNLSTIDVSFLAQGLYLIKIKTENGEITKKFIKE